MFDATQEKIIHAAMRLIAEQGYHATTTKMIAKEAGVNECTIFRRFGEKQEIVTAAMETETWNPQLSEHDFPYKGNLKKDLNAFAVTYMERMTPQIIRLHNCLLAAGAVIREDPVKQLATEEVRAAIHNNEQVFYQLLVRYFTEMQEKRRLENIDADCAAMHFLAVCHGFLSLTQSVDRHMMAFSAEEYCRNSVKFFLKGIRSK